MRMDSGEKSLSSLSCLLPKMPYFSRATPVGCGRQGRDAKGGCLRFASQWQRTVLGFFLGRLFIVIEYQVTRSK